MSNSLCLLVGLFIWVSGGLLGLLVAKDGADMHNTLCMLYV